MKRVQDWIAVHRKIIVFIVGAALTLAIEKWGTSNEWVSLGIIVATGLGVYGAPNAAAQPEPQPALASVPQPEPQDGVFPATQPNPAPITPETAPDPPPGG